MDRVDVSPHADHEDLQNRPNQARSFVTLCGVTLNSLGPLRSGKFLAEHDKELCSAYVGREDGYKGPSLRDLPTATSPRHHRLSLRASALQLYIHIYTAIVPSIFESAKYKAKRVADFA